ncbi:MAG TPA: GNAT family N-acetyltransferase [Acidimicrobiales bacterium]|nr:GNAT family N-acetyltransferase [Acidimicrobiales bacterium]
MGDVRMATVEDRELLARICAEGFFADPVLGWVFQDEASRLEKLLVVFGGLVDDYLPDRGVVHLADAASAAFWRDPTFEDVSTAADRAEAVGPQPGDEPGPFDEGELARLTILGTAMAESHPHDRPHWYLNVVSTLPSRQGRGLGGVVLRPVLEQADADGLPCYLESTNPRNRTLYYRQGFEDLGELPLDGGPTMLAMWREPQG